jgi:PAS domain-containing protein
VTNIDGTDSSRHDGPDAAVPDPLRHPLGAWDGFLERLPVGAYICDIEGRIVRHNRRVAQMWGRAPAPGESEAALW